MVYLVWVWLALIITPSALLGPSTVSIGWEGAQSGRSRGEDTQGEGAEKEG